MCVRNTLDTLHVYFILYGCIWILLIHASKISSLTVSEVDLGCDATPFLPSVPISLQHGSCAPLSVRVARRDRIPLSALSLTPPLSPRTATETPSAVSDGCDTHTDDTRRKGIAISPYS